MKRISIASALALATAAPALAADLPPYRSAAAGSGRLTFRLDRFSAGPVFYVGSMPGAHSATPAGPCCRTGRAASRRSGRCSAARSAAIYQIGGSSRSVRKAISIGRIFAALRPDGSVASPLWVAALSPATGSRPHPWPSRLRSRPRSVLHHRRAGRFHEREALDRRATLRRRHRGGLDCRRRHRIRHDRQLDGEGRVSLRVSRT